MAGCTIVLDACLVITFGNAEALHVVAELNEHRVAVARRAADEVTREPASGELQRCIAAETIELASIDLGVATEQEALARFDASPRFRGRGDAEVLALSASRGWIAGSDEIAVRQVAQAELGAARVAGNLDFLRWAVGESRLSVARATRLLESLDVGPALLRRIAAAGQTRDVILGARERQ